MNRKDKRDIITGVLIALFIPLVLCGLLYMVFDFLDKNVEDNVISSMLLFGLGLNLYFMLRFFKSEQDFKARGIIMTTFVYAIIYIIRFVIDF